MRTHEEMTKLFCPISGDKCMGKECGCCEEDGFKGCKLSQEAQQVIDRGVRNQRTLFTDYPIVKEYMDCKILKNDGCDNCELRNPTYRCGWKM